MDRKRLIYIGLILILTVIVSITYFSYAFFTHKDEQSGKLNIVTGTLDYQIESNDLTNNSITLEANKSKQIEIEITSLNNIDSKYELYYQTSATNVVIGYGSNYDTPAGSISAMGKKTVMLVIRNRSNVSATISFGVTGGFSNNTLVLETGNSIVDIIDSICDYETGYVWNFSFDPDGDGKGQAQAFETPCDGIYQLEVWGAEGYSYGSNKGGYGAYSIGSVLLNYDTDLFIYVGQKGSGGVCNGTSYSSFPNAGTSTCKDKVSYTGSGGGSTHIALENKKIAEMPNDYQSKLLIVAGGGGAGTGTPGGWYGAGGSGGGKVGVQINGNSFTGGGGGSQTSGGAAGGNSNASFKGLFGESASVSGSSGGGGFYGGGGSWGGGGGGGSGYIGSSVLLSASASTKKMVCYSCTQDLTNESTYTVSTTCVQDSATSNCTKKGHGQARITYLGE